MDPEEIIILLVGAAIIVNVVLLPDILDLYDNLQDKAISFYHLSLEFIFSWKGLVTFLILLLPFILIVNYNLNIGLSNIFYQRKSKIKRTEQERENIKNMLKVDITELKIKGLSKFKKGLSKKIYLISKLKKLKEFEDALWKKEQESERLLVKLKREKVLDGYYKEQERLKQENEKIREENESLRLEQENKNFAILRELGADRNKVFFRDDLSEDEIVALHEDGYEDSNEYDVCEKRVIPVLVKKVMNHSKTHTFLVWSVKRLLEEMDAEDIEEHDTRLPDITFLYNKEEFAIEIETGSLLSKKQQLKEKLKFLNNKFGWKWMFVVSNKNLLSKYRKLGFTTQRSEVEENLKKLLNSDL